MTGTAHNISSHGITIATRNTADRVVQRTSTNSTNQHAERGVGNTNSTIGGTADRVVQHITTNSSNRFANDRGGNTTPTEQVGNTNLQANIVDRVVQRTSTNGTNQHNKRGDGNTIPYNTADHAVQRISTTASTCGDVR